MIKVRKIYDKVPGCLDRGRYLSILNHIESDDCKATIFPTPIMAIGKIR